MSATQGGVNNSASFMDIMTTLKKTKDKDAVTTLLKSHDWQGVVDFAKTYRYFDFEELPFSADDVDVGMNCWSFFAVPEDFESEGLRGGVMVSRKYSTVGFGIFAEGGLSSVAQGFLLATHPDSANAGTPVGSPKKIPFIPKENCPVTISDWILSMTSTGQLGFFKGSSCRFLLADTGKVWTRQHPDLKKFPLERSDGNLVPSGSPVLAAGGDIKTSLIDYASERWSVSADELGNLVFRLQSSGGTAIMIADGTKGRICDGSGVAYEAEEVKMIWDEVYDALTRHINEVTDEAIGWMKNVTDISTSWVADAAMSSWDWINQTSSAGWNEVKDVWSKITNVPGLPSIPVPSIPVPKLPKLPKF